MDFADTFNTDSVIIFKKLTCSPMSVFRGIYMRVRGNPTILKIIYISYSLLPSAVGVLVRTRKPKLFACNTNNIPPEGGIELQISSIYVVVCV